MKRIIYITLLAMLTATVAGQQFPFMEGYNINPFDMMPSYAGLVNPKTVFIDYRTDWTGIDGGPVTCNLSYSDRLKDNVGIGGRFVYDKTDIFRQTMLLGTYTYEIQVFKGHFVNFGVSAGFYKNSIDFGKYYNDPDYVEDPALTYGTERSRIKIATDISALYRYMNIEGGVLFSNIIFGTAKYSDTDISYKPFKNYLVHASYNYGINDAWTVKPFLMLRGGQHYPSQLELAAEAVYNKKFWGMLLFRTGGIWGMSFGAEVYNGICLNYSYNLSSDIALNTFGSHQVTMGINLSHFNFIKSK